MIPIKATIKRIELKTRIWFPYFEVKVEKRSVALCLKSFVVSESFIFINDISEGNAVKIKTKATAIPKTIIFPKSITGFISLTESDAKATIVVSAVYKQGKNISL